MEETQTIQISDSDVDRIAAAVARSVSGDTAALASGLERVESTIYAAADTLGADVAALRSDPSVSQIVSVSGEQWQHVTDSLNLNSALSMFTLALVAVIVGMRFFSEFSRGFRRA